MKILASLVCVLLSTAAQAATISEGSPVGGVKIALNVADFTDRGRCGFGSSVVNDGCSVIAKSDPEAPHAYGRFDPLAPPSEWIDSQDLSDVTWTITHDVAFTSLSFALTDAFDQRPAPRLGLGESFFQLLADGASWSIDSREANGTLHWLTVGFDQPTTTAELRFLTRLNDGWGVSSASVSEVPLPAAGWLLLMALGGVAAARRRAA